MLTLPLFLGWCGMRGVVSLAAALAIPITLDNGAEFPQRNLILFITFIAILLTLVVQGLTLPYFIKRSGIFNHFIDEEAENLARQRMKKELKQAIVNFLLENDKEFQITNYTKNKFRLYIYDDKGEYLIGGEDVANFIERAIDLLIKS